VQPSLTLGKSQRIQGLNRRSGTFLPSIHATISARATFGDRRNMLVSRFASEGVLSRFEWIVRNLDGSNTIKSCHWLDKLLPTSL
jgi:hypothetical protein